MLALNRSVLNAE